MTGPVNTTGAHASPVAGTKVNGPDMAKLKKTAQQFEEVFLRQLIGSMRSASVGDGMFDSDATKQFRDMSDAKTAETMAGKGALGIADLLVKQYGARLAPSVTPGDAPATPDAKASR